MEDTKQFIANMEMLGLVYGLSPSQIYHLTWSQYYLYIKDN